MDEEEEEDIEIQIDQEDI